MVKRVKGGNSISFLRRRGIESEKVKNKVSGVRCQVSGVRCQVSGVGKEGCSSGVRKSKE